MRSDVKSDPGYAYRWLPIIFAALALGGLFVLVLLQPEPVYGTVLSVREGNDGEMYATVEYVDPQSGETVVDSLLLPLQHLDAETVPVWPGNEGNQPQIGAFGRVELTPTLAVSVAGIAALLGFVVQFHRQRLRIRAWHRKTRPNQPHRSRRGPRLLLEDVKPQTSGCQCHMRHVEPRESINRQRGSCPR